MKRTLSFIFIALFFSGLAHAIQVGEPENAVRSVLGNPVAVRKKSDSEQVWKFKDGTTVWLTNGIVQKIAEPTVANSVVRQNGSGPTGAAAVAAPARKMPETTAPAAAMQSEMKNRAVDFIQNLQQVGYWLLCGVLAVLVISKVRSYLAVFKARGAWHSR